MLSLIDGALLTPKEIGAGFTKAPYTPSDPTTKLPCGQTSPAALFPNSLRTGTTIAKGEQAQFQESVSLFLDTATALNAYAAGVAGVSCGKAEVGGSSATISQRQDVTAQVGGDTAEAWTIQIGADQGVLVAVTKGSLVVGFTFISAGGVDATKLPQPLTLVKTAVKKLLATGVS